MRIDNLARLIGAKILNSPDIIEIRNYAFSLEKIVYGSVYIMKDFNLQDIKKAITLGAYAIIVEDDFDVKFYNEIAILKVDSIKACILRLLRYELTLKNSKLIFSDLITIELIKLISKRKFEILRGDLSEVFIRIFNQNENSIFLTYDEFLLKELIYGYEIVNDCSFSIVSQTSLFTSSLILNETFISFPNFPLLFASNLCKAVNFCIQNEILYDLNEIKQLKNFSVIFIDESFAQKSFGSTSKLLIVEYSRDFFQKELEFLKCKFDKNFKSCSLKSDNLSSEIKLENLEQIKEIGDFNYLLIFAQRDEVLKVLNQKKEQEKLF